jgi:hypothetical protein
LLAGRSHCACAVKWLSLFSGLSRDYRKLAWQNDFYLPDGRLAARIITQGAFLDLKTRRIIAPEADIRELLDNFKRSDNFTEMISSKASL